MKPIKWSLKLLKWLSLVKVVTSHDFGVLLWITSNWKILNSYFFSAPARHLPEKPFLMFFSVPFQQMTWMGKFSQSIRRNLIKQSRDQKFRTLWMWLPITPIYSFHNIAILSQKSKRSISIQYLILFEKRLKTT